MLEKPDLPDEAIAACLAQAYGIHVADLTFLPIGYDALAWVFNVTADDGRRFFLKLRKGAIYAASFTVPRHLHDHGIAQVVTPLAGLFGKLWAETDGYSLILYPYVEGVIAAEIGLSEQQRIEFGRVLAAIHHTALPSLLRESVKVEDYVPPWSAMVRKLSALIEHENFDDLVSQTFVREWQQRSAEIDSIVKRAEALGLEFESHSPEHLLCHADIHEHNMLVAPDGSLHIVDWDGIILAPKERDLMFVVDVEEDDPQRLRLTERERLFFQGYGDAPVDPIGLAYYRYEWVVQEIGDCGERVLLTPANGDQTRRASVQDFIELFQPGDVVEGAYRSGPNRQLHKP